MDKKIEELLEIINRKDAEIAVLTDKVSTFNLLSEEVNNLKNKLSEMALLIINYEEKLKLATIKKFGRSTEKKEFILNEAEQIIDEEKKTSPDKKKPGKKQGSKNLNNKPNNLERVIHDVYLDQTNCCCGSSLKDFSFEASEKIEVIPAKVIIKETRYHKYVCEECSKIIISDKNVNPFPNTLLSSSLAASIIVDKYLLAVPLYRQEAYYQSFGIDLSRQNLANYIIYTYKLLEPLIEVMKKKMINNPSRVIHSDDTVLKVIHKQDDNRVNCYMWFYATSRFDTPILIYDYRMTRGAINPEDFLKDYNGTIICDGITVYDNINDQIKIGACWAHVRRKYTDLIKTLTQEQKKKSKAVFLLKIIDEIFKFERSYRELNLNPDEILEKRNADIRPLIEVYQKEIYENTFDDNTLIGKAVLYSKNIWDKLVLFLSDGHVEITNNLAERGIKPFVIGRKNFLFCNTETGAKASALLYSLVETAKANLINVEEYLKYIIDNISNTKYSDLPELMPWHHNIQNKFSIKIYQK